METLGEVIPDLLTKTMKQVGSNRYCDVHELDVPEETIRLLDQTFTFPGQCPACADEQKRMEERNKVLEEQTNRIRIRRLMGVPERYVLASIHDFLEETPAQKYVGVQLRTFVDGGWDGSPGLLFLGNVGTGKTMLGAALVNHWLDHHGSRSGRFCTILELLSRVKATWRPESMETESQAYRRLTDLPLLVIDEIGVQFGSPGEKTIFTELINRRYNALHPTVLIGNLTIKEFGEALGERVLDRFRDGGHTLAFTWPSQRGIKRLDVAPVR